MSLKNIDFDSAFGRLADRRIEEAMKEGKFDNLPGAGEPLELDAMPAEENARMTWWALRIMRQNDFTPDEVRWRKTLDDLRARIASAGDERLLVALVRAANELVYKINTLGTNALSTHNTAITPIDLDAERSKFMARRDSKGD